MAPALEGVKVRGADLLPALAVHRLDGSVITPVDTSDPGTGAPVRGRGRPKAERTERDAATEKELAAFIDALEDGAHHAVCTHSVLACVQVVLLSCHRQAASQCGGLFPCAA